MMREKNIEKVVKEFIAKEMAIDPASITRETNLVNDLNADSMSVVNVVTAIESKFKITFPDESEVKYEGYTLQFLIDGVMYALQRNDSKNKEQG
ncbi:MAG: acyl carrier protein [Bacteroidaceae bacterium]|nr:acyl carrier protein [Bacteroidaceae bacterium]